MTVITGCALTSIAQSDFKQKLRNQESPIPNYFFRDNPIEKNDPGGLDVADRRLQAESASGDHAQLIRGNVHRGPFREANEIRVRRALCSWRDPTSAAQRTRNGAEPAERGWMLYRTFGVGIAWIRRNSPGNTGK
jgi:hypothetical protein